MNGHARREQIIDAALEVFARSGLSGARTREIARQAGVSEALIFRHFRSKDELYQATLERLIAEHPAEEDFSMLAAQRDDLRVLRAIAFHGIHHGRRDPRMLRLGLLSALERVDATAGPAPPAPEWKEDGLEDALSEYLQQRTAEGALNVRDPAVTARLFLVAMLGYVVAQETGLRGPPLPATDAVVADTLARTFLLGLRPREDK